MIGIVKWFSDKKGYGFIEVEDGTNIFVHYSVVDTEGFKSLDEGQKVSFKLIDTNRGPQAIDVKIITTC